MKTHYDVLGVVPAIRDADLAAAYKEAVITQLEEPFYRCTSMARGPRLNRIAELTAAYLAINHGDRRHQYNLKLMKDALICPVCEGRGRIIPDQLKSIECAACRGTGKGVGCYE
jgi:hypothetical protein